MEEIKKLKQSIAVVNAKVSYLREGFEGLEKAIKDLNSDLDAFVDVYTGDIDDIRERLSKVEERLGL